MAQLTCFPGGFEDGIICYGTIVETSESTPCYIDIHNKSQFLTLLEESTISKCHSILKILSNAMTHNNREIATIDEVTLSAFSNIPTETKLEVVICKRLPLDLPTIHRVPVGLNIYGRKCDSQKLVKELTDHNLFLQDPDVVSDDRPYWNPQRLGNVGTIGLAHDYGLGKGVMFLVIENFCRSEEDKIKMRSLTRLNDVHGDICARHAEALERARRISNETIDLSKFEDIMSKEQA